MQNRKPSERDIFTAFRYGEQSALSNIKVLLCEFIRRSCQFPRKKPTEKCQKIVMKCTRAVRTVYISGGVSDMVDFSQLIKNNKWLNSY